MKSELSRADSFHVEIDGISAAVFARAAGLGASRELLAYDEGGYDGRRLFAGRLGGGKIALERGVTRESSLFRWFESGERRDGAVVLVDPGGRERCRWRLRGAIPTRWGGPLLSASVASVALETFELSYEAIEWADD